MGDDGTQQLLRDILSAQRETASRVDQIAVAVARVEQRMSGHVDLQSERTRRRDERCRRSESRADALESTVSDLQRVGSLAAGGQAQVRRTAHVAGTVLALLVGAWGAIR
jgi:hypothetical protein